MLSVILEWYRSRPHLADPIARFWQYVNRTDGCWLWIGGHEGNGYGTFSIMGKKHGPVTAHTFAYWLSGKVLRKGFTLDHTCHNRSCVRIDHLEEVTNTENILRGEGLTAQNSRKTHCKRGHPLSGDNLRINPAGYRQCRACGVLRPSRIKS